ncbi:MAG: hypothetical protein ACO4CF_08990, partial [bacterium]
VVLGFATRRTRSCPTALSFLNCDQFHNDSLQILVITKHHNSLEIRVMLLQCNAAHHWDLF